MENKNDLEIFNSSFDDIYKDWDVKLKEMKEADWDKMLEELRNTNLEMTPQEFDALKFDDKLLDEMLTLDTTVLRDFDFDILNDNKEAKK